MYILGISCFYHDSAACLVKDGNILAAAQEERFTRKKFDDRFPEKSIEYCLKEGKIKVDELDLIVFYENPAIKFNRILDTFVHTENIDTSYRESVINLWSTQKLWQEDIIRAETGYKGKIIFPLHHQSHAASAFFPSPFEEAAILTLDGVGEYMTTTIGVGEGNQISFLKSIDFPHSLGMLYSAFTYFCGFKVNSGEYKLMGLAPYGKPKYVDLIKDNLIDIKEDGSYRLNLKYFDYMNGNSMINANFRDLFRLNERKPESKITQEYMDIAKSIQVVLEEIVLNISKYARKVTKKSNLCMAGGVALNCVAIGKILKEKVFDKLWIQPAAGDAGGALGAALFGWYQYLDNERLNNGFKDQQKSSLLGPAFSSDAIKEMLDSVHATYEEIDEQSLIDKISELIIQEKVVGHFHGRMEYGPRALGNRSILGDARSLNLQKTMNLKIKYRESFRPFAPSVIAEAAKDLFELEVESPYMLLTVPVTVSIRYGSSVSDNSKQGLEKLNTVRSKIPAITHVDYSARVQTVAKEDNPRFYNLIKAVGDKTGYAVVINTSFNVRGEPIVCTPRDAFNCFMNTDMDYLVLENCFLEKSKQAKNVIYEKNGKFELD